MEEQLTLDEQLVKDTVDNRESWLEKVNTHLETLLEKENKDVKLQSIWPSIMQEETV